MSAAEQLRDQIIVFCRATRGLDDLEIEWALADALSVIIIGNAASAESAKMRIDDVARTMHEDARHRWRWPLKPKVT
jgi:hypothetical protein